MSFQEQPAKTADAHLYWARNKSQSAPVQHKPLSAEEAAALEAQAAASAGAAWNKAATWEEKAIGKWSSELLRDTMLPELAYTLPSEGGSLPALPADSEGLTPVATCKVRVATVESVSGDVTYVISRGKERCVFELALKMKLEMELWEGSELKTIISGQIHIPEGAPTERTIHPPCASRACVACAAWPLSIAGSGCAGVLTTRSGYR